MFQTHAGNNYKWSTYKSYWTHTTHISVVVAYIRFHSGPLFKLLHVFKCLLQSQIFEKDIWLAENKYFTWNNYLLPEVFGTLSSRKKKHFNKCQPHLQKISTITNHARLFQDYHLKTNPNCCWDNSTSFDVTGKLQVKIFLCLAFTISAKIL